MATPTEQTLRAELARIAARHELDLSLRACASGKVGVTLTTPFPPPTRGQALRDLSPALTRRDLAHWLLGFEAALELTVAKVGVQEAG